MKTTNNTATNANLSYSAWRMQEELAASTLVRGQQQSEDDVAAFFVALAELDLGKCATRKAIARGVTRSLLQGKAWFAQVDGMNGKPGWVSVRAYETIGTVDAPGKIWLEIKRCDGLTTETETLNPGSEVAAGRIAQSVFFDR